MTQQQQQQQKTETELEEVLAGYRSEHGDTDYLREVASIVQSEIGVKFLDEMRPEFSKAHVLSNRNDAEIHEALALISFRTNQFLQEHPPEGSRMTGSLRTLVYGDQNEALSRREVREVLAIEEILKARCLQSRDMEQQKIIKEMRQDQHLTQESLPDRNGGSLGDRIRNAFQ